MNCNEIKKHIPLYIKGIEKKEISIEIEKHLENCPDCKKTLEFEKTIDSKINDFFNEIPEISVDNHIGKLNKGNKKTINFKKYFLIAATLLIAVFLIPFLTDRKVNNINRNMVDAKYLQGINDIKTLTVKVNNINYQNQKLSNITVKKIKKNIVWLTVNN